MGILGEVWGSWGGFGGPKVVLVHETGGLRRGSGVPGESWSLKLGVLGGIWGS